MSADLMRTGAPLPRRVRVDGGSMLPLLHPGDHLLVLPLRPVAGRLVVVRDPRAPARVLVKRCTGVHADGAVEVRGDNPGASTDSRTFGAVPGGMVLGRPTYRYAPAARAGWLIRW